MIGPALLLLMFAADDQPVKKAAGARVSFGSKMPVALDDQEDGPTEQQTLAELAKVRRIYVDVLSGGDSALRIRDLLMSSIQASKLFIVTEDEEKADAVLKGAGRDEVFTDLFQSSDNINMHSQIGLGSSSNDPYAGGGSSHRNTSIGAGENESHHIEERKHEAIATVRLVNRDGDVIWAATEESLGAKFVGASVDVVDKITKKLSSDFRKAKVQSRETPSTSTK